MPSPVGPRRILVVEDDDDTREVLTILLNQFGHEVAEAGDGPRAVETFSRALPQVVLIDVGLPGIDGYEVARRIRSLPEGKRTFLIALTGYGQPEDRRRAEEAGFDAHLVKPVDPDRLNRLLLTERSTPPA